MGLLDQILQAAKAAGMPGDPAQYEAVYEGVSKVVAQEGGVAGLTQKFQKHDLGGIINGWVSSGVNPPINAEQVMKIVGKDRIMAMAGKAGLSEEQVTAGISKIMPLVVDHLTPNGTDPGHSPAQLQDALSLIKSKLFSA